MSPRDSMTFNDKQLEHSSDIIRWARWLGYAGVLPFVISAALCFSDNLHWQQMAQQSLINYAVIIISFIGALHWGSVLQSLKHNSHPKLVLSIMPSLIAWLALFLPSVYAIGVLIMLFISMLVIDTKLW